MSDLSRAVKLLQAGRLVAFPTETVYGLGANALNERALRRIYEAKGRPLSSPLIVHIDSIDAARELANDWPFEANLLAKQFWPGPLTLVVAKRSLVPDLVTGGLNSVGLRVPAHPLALELLEAVGIPLAAPSANRFTQISPTTAEHVRQGLGNAVDLVLDGGPCTVGIESTVLSFAGKLPKLLRPGMITREQIERVIGAIEIGTGPESPGQHAKHYSPRTKVYLGHPPADGAGFHLTRDKMPSDPTGYAAQLYATLHALDSEGWDWIAIELPPDQPEWAGVRDRLQRAVG